MHDHELQRRMVVRGMLAGDAMSIFMVSRANFLPPASCKLVEGKIRSNRWCALRARKQA